MEIVLNSMKNGMKNLLILDETTFYVNKFVESAVVLLCDAGKVFAR